MSNYKLKKSLKLIILNRFKNLKKDGYFLIT
jgi:hypothetical protein